MHYGTVLAIRSPDDRIKKQVVREVAESRQRYVVSDLKRTTKDHNRAYAVGAGGDPQALPEWLAAKEGDKFPWNQPVVFRSGRYVVHRIERPLGVIDIPDWKTVDDPAARRRIAGVFRSAPPVHARSYQYSPLETATAPT